MLRIVLALVCSFLSSELMAADGVLRIAVNRYAPPYVMQGAKKVVYGFDVAMMDTLCKRLNVDCRYAPVPFGELLPSLSSDKADIALGEITITADRSKKVNFTTSYLPSKCQFIGVANAGPEEVFTLDKLAGKRIAVEEGTYFDSQLETMQIKDAKILSLSTQTKVIEALSNKEADYALVDEATASYWQRHAEGTIQAYGPSMPYGFGLGIAVNPNNLNLLKALNSVLAEYLQSPEFKKDYAMYFETAGF